MIYTSTPIVTVTEIPTVAVANSAGHVNIKKLKIYLNEEPTRPDFKQIRK